MELFKLTGERIRAFVERRGYASMELFAHENGLAKSTLSELLSGKNDPKLSTLARICAGLEITLAELFRDGAIESSVREEAPDYDPSLPRRRGARGTHGTNRTQGKSRKG